MEFQIRRWNEIPSVEEFATQIERRNLPAVIGGCVSDWKATSRWDVSNGGLDYLQELVGSSVVEAMLSRSAPLFYGDIRSHERVPLQFSTFIEYCKSVLQSEDDAHNYFSRSKENKPVEPSSQHSNSFVGDEAPQQMYLAQVPIMNMENEKVQLECLREDILTPTFLKGKTLSAINLWMNNARTRSSTHYDPHHNLLCVISGCKQVTLWPPSAMPFLYPLPIYGEASNHSAVALENPNLVLYPRAECIDDYSQKVILNAGDALFIPEGWFHQVDSHSLTIAVNFWWVSDLISGMLEHMDAYYLRQILKRLIDKQMDQMLCINASNVDKKSVKTSVQSIQPNSVVNTSGYGEENLGMNNQSASLKQRKTERSFMLQELDPLALQKLHELVSLVHDHVKPERSASSDQSVGGEDDVMYKTDKTSLFNLEEDPLASIIFTLDTHTFQSVFLAMAHNFPRTLEALVLHALSPVGSEVITKRFEQMNEVIDADEGNQFYQKIYSVFDNQFSAMDTLLNQKELFACQAFKNVLVQYLGINMDGSKP